MRRVIIRFLLATAVLGGLLSGGTIVAAANPAAAPTTGTPDPPCSLGETPVPTQNTCMPPGYGG